MFNLDQFLKDKFYKEALIAKIKLLPDRDLQAVSNLLSDLLPNANIFRQIFSLLEELSLAQKTSIAEVLLAYTETSKTWGEGSRKDKQVRLRSFLEQMRFPMRFKIQKKLELCVEQISRDFGVSLSLPEELEGETVEIKFKVRGSKELKVKSEKIQALAQSEICEQIFNILEGKEL